MHIFHAAITVCFRSCACLVFNCSFKGAELRIQFGGKKEHIFKLDPNYSERVYKSRPFLCQKHLLSSCLHGLDLAGLSVDLFDLP